MAAPIPSHPLAPLRPYVNGERDMNVHLPAIGELIMMRLPFNMPGPTSIISNSAISGSNERNYHPCLVIRMVLDDDCWEVEVYICRSFREKSDPVSYVRSLPPSDYNLFLPLPSCYIPPPDTPSGFGAPLSFNNSYYSQKPGWLLAKPTIVYMDERSPVCCLSRVIDVLVHIDPVPL